MLSKKIFLSAALVSMAGFVACGDDSSSNAGSKGLPNSVPTFFDLKDVECNADRKCETIIVEDGPDTYECDGSQWNMLINSMPSKVCPAKENKKTEGDENDEGDEDNTPESSASEADSNDNDDSTEGSSSSEENKGNDNCIDKSQCDAMVRGDVSTWHFTRADAFGEPSVYVYSVADNGTDLIVNIDGKEKSYSMYNMSTEVGKEMAFSAAKATCNDGMEVEGANYCK